MHPAYRADRPGDAPCCGMRLIAIFSEKEMSGSQPNGATHVTQRQQQIAGVRVEPVVVHTGKATVRTTGRVAPDENRVYRINASTEMWIRKLYPPTTGTPISKDQPLCGFYTTNFLTAAQSYIYILNATDQLTAAGQTSFAQKASNDLQLRQAEELLLNLGVSKTQIAEMAKTRQASALVDVRSPVGGYVLSRNLTLGQWLAPGTELYQIADLTHVWIYADLFESDARAFRPGSSARIWSPTLKQHFSAKLSDLPAAFDSATRVSRLRLDLDNAKRTLWPGMFVDVEIPVDMPEGISIPAEAIIDTGLRKTVFVDLGNGNFEPREIETGARSGDRIQVTQGLTKGERIVTSGTFLIDSESKFQSAAAALTTTAVAQAKDPSCGMDVNPATAKHKSTRNGVTHYFCSEQCKRAFEAKNS